MLISQKQIGITDFYLKWIVVKISNEKQSQIIIDYLKKDTKSERIIGAIDIDAVFNKKHFLSAVWHAIVHWENNLRFSQSIPTEILLYLTGTRQIRKALQFAGISPETKYMLVYCISKNEKHAATTLRQLIRDLNFNITEFEFKTPGHVQNFLQKWKAINPNIEIKVNELNKTEIKNLETIVLANVASTVLYF